LGHKLNPRSSLAIIKIKDYNFVFCCSQTTNIDIAKQHKNSSQKKDEEQKEKAVEQKTINYTI
jgi:hypothetical protein